MVHPHRGTTARRGLGLGIILLVVIIIAALATAGLMLRQDPGVDSETAAELYTVVEGDFDITVPASGELTAMRQREIASRLDAQAVITEIVDEGVQVSAGDVLIRLDDADIKDRIKDVEVAVKNAETALLTARTNLAIKQEANRSELMLADVDIRLAEIALTAWREGTNPSTIKQLGKDVETSEKDYKRLQERFAKSQELFQDNFISKDELEREEIEMLRAESRYEQAVSAHAVYVDYTREQDQARLEADLQRARDRRKETEDRNANELRRLETEVENKELAFAREQERFSRAEMQLSMCTITAPQDGLVVYASSLNRGGRGNDETPPEVGTELRRNRTVIVLPDTSHMVAEVKVNEALTGRIDPGQSVMVYSDALPNVPLPGTVLDVGVLAESGGWRDPNRRDYTVRVDLGPDNRLGLKPSMRCKASIEVGRVEGALFVPVQAVFREGPVAFTYVPADGGYAPRIVSLGRASDLNIEITDGLEAGDTVLLRRPTPAEIRGELDPQAIALASEAAAPERRAPPSAAAESGRSESTVEGGGPRRGRGERSGRPRGSGRPSGDGASNAAASDSTTRQVRDAISPAAPAAVR